MGLIPPEWQHAGGIDLPDFGSVTVTLGAHSMMDDNGLLEGDLGSKPTPRSTRPTICTACRFHTVVSREDSSGNWDFSYFCEHPMFATPGRIDFVTGVWLAETRPRCSDINGGACPGFRSNLLVRVLESFAEMGCLCLTLGGIGGVIWGLIRLARHIFCCS